MSSLDGIEHKLTKYFLNGCFKVIYDDDSDSVVFEEIDLHKVEWKPCSRRARKFVPLSSKPATVKANWKPLPKFANSIMDHSVKGYADDAMLISTNIDTHSYVLQEIDKRTADLDLMLKPSKCVSFLFDGAKHLSQGIPKEQLD